MLGETIALFIRFWMTITPLPDSAQAAASTKSTERFESFLQNLGRQLATGDSFLTETSHDAESPAYASEPAGAERDPV
ncbi:hypothetical protein [Rhizobium lusitanum]|uniref:Uncharacterized protein n=1 Tax=Rhizobium lusitanum TaxID=293958 RepID=A0A7X0ITX9_9HYPH|nr:hypothetical protein [Rhizobium lusitanum]